MNNSPFKRELKRKEELENLTVLSNPISNKRSRLNHPNNKHPPIKRNVKLYLNISLPRYVTVVDRYGELSGEMSRAETELERSGAEPTAAERSGAE